MLLENDSTLTGIAFYLLSYRCIDGTDSSISKWRATGFIGFWMRLLPGTDNSDGNRSRKALYIFSLFHSLDTPYTMMSLATKTAAVRAPVTATTCASRRSVVVRASANTNDMVQVRIGFW